MTEKQIPIDDIHVVLNIRSDSDEQVADLMGSIKQQGLLEPIRVWRDSKKTRYILDIGHRRLSALKKLGWTKVEVGTHVIINEEEYSSSAHIQRIISENSKRMGNTYLETARMVQMLVEKEELSPEQCAIHLNMPLSRIKNMLELWKWASPIIKERTGLGSNARAEGNLPSRTAAKIVQERALHNKPNIQDEIAIAVIKQSLPYDAVERIISLVTRQGLPVADAIEVSTLYTGKTIHLLVKTSVFNEVVKQYPKVGFGTLVQKALKGEIVLPRNLFYEK